MKILIWHGSTDGALVYDAFTAANGTNLTAHTPEVGPNPTVPDGTYQIQGNKAQCTATGASGYGIALYETNHANVAASVVVRLNGGAVARHGLAIRAIDGNNHWRITIKLAPAFEIVEVNGGTQTIRASAAPSITADTDYTIACKADGTTLSATLNGGNPISYGSATMNPTTTTHGLDNGAANEATADTLRISL